MHLKPVAAGIVDDPVDNPNSGYQEIVGYRPTRLIDIPTVLVGFDNGLGSAARESYLAWVRDVAEARWFAEGLEDLPWWKETRDASEIVEQETHPDAKTFDGQPIEIGRLSIAVADFAEFYEQVSGHSILDLSSPLRTPELIRGRIELTILAVSRFELRSSEIATLISKHPFSLTRWLKVGTLLGRGDCDSRNRIDRLDGQISAAALDNASLRSVAPQESSADQHCRGLKLSKEPHEPTLLSHHPR